MCVCAVKSTQFTFIMCGMHAISSSPFHRLPSNGKSNLCAHKVHKRMTYNFPFELGRQMIIIIIFQQKKKDIQKVFSYSLYPQMQLRAYTLSSTERKSNISSEQIKSQLRDCFHIIWQTEANELCQTRHYRSFSSFFCYFILK